MIIDMWSDTVTKPTDAMRRVMAAAPVGNEAEGEDPSVNSLLARACKLLDKEAALYLPSATMCNLVACRTHCRASDEVLMETTAHVGNYEGGGAAAVVGLMIKRIRGERGMFTAE